MIKKLSQHTELDKDKYNFGVPGVSKTRYDQEVLPFGKGDEDYNSPNKELYRDITYRDKDNKRKEKPTEPINFNFPDLTPEQIKYRKMTEQERIRLVDEDNDRYRRWDQHDRRWQPEFKPQYDEQYKLDKALPEDIKKEILKQYQKLQLITKEFQTRYFEANQWAQESTELNYEGTYFDLFRNISKYMVAISKKKLGELFGNTKEKKRYYGRDKSSQLADFLNKGLNLFNITPLNYQTKISEMKNAISYMISISENYDKRKKVMEKLPDLINKEVKSFLLKRDNRKFLKWMDEYYPNDKKEFIKNFIDNLQSGSHNRNGFGIEELSDIKTYKGIYEKAKSTATTSLMHDIRHKTKEDITKNLKEEFETRATKKVNTLINVIDESDNNLDIISKYFYKNYRFDLKPLFAFIEQAFNDRFKEYEKEGNNAPKKDDIFPEGTFPTTPEKYNSVAQEKLREFKEQFITDFKKSLLDFNKDHWHKNQASEKYVGEFLLGLKSPIGNNRIMMDFELLSTKTAKDMDDLVDKYIKDDLVNSLPNFEESKYGYSRHHNSNYPVFSGLGSLIRESGRFSINDFVNTVHKNMPDVPKEFVLNLVRTVIKGGYKNEDNPLDVNKLNQNQAFELLSHSVGTYNKTATKVMLDLLKRSGKLNPNSFTNVFLNGFEGIKYMVSKLLLEVKTVRTDDQVIAILSQIIRNPDTIDRDKDNFIEYIDFIHNSASDILPKDLHKMFSNKNFSQYSKSGIVQRLFKAYAQIKSLGGIVGLNKEYGNVIKELKVSGFISRSFETNIRYIVKTFESGEMINPSSPEFKKLFDITSALETDLQTIEMSDALKELIVDYRPKDKRLFNLDMEINDRLRFRVLKDKDPRMLRVGIESGCCQRIGGAGEGAAKDSFVNPTAGVLILEWKDSNDKWVMLGQSYFHYVATTNSYFLDNIEHAYGNVRASGVDMEAAYAYIAKQMKEKFNVENFLAGKGYSKIETSAFKSNKLRGGDPRYFDPKAGHKYTDFDPNNSMDLLEPKFDMKKREEKLTGKKNEIIEAFERVLGRIIRTAMVA